MRTIKHFYTWLFAAIILLAVPGLFSDLNAQTAGNVLRFGIVTDVHYADIPDNGSRTYSRSLVKLQAFVDTMNLLKPDFVIELGDFKDMDKPPIPAKTLIYLDRAERTFAGFNGPRYHVAGNHDMDCISKSKFLSVIENTGIEPGESYYSFDIQGFHCVVLDACYDSAGADYDSGHYKWEDANIPAQELQWLRKDLKKSGLPSLVFIHHRLDGSGAYFVKHAAVVRRILARHGNVKAVFQGHYHEGYFQCINNIPYYTLKSLVEGNSPKGYNFALIEVSNDGVIGVRGFGEVETEELNCPGVLPIK
ncbi:MAG TPA: metallophosphoesterase [Bacteroidales bacterium]|nr:metallophosphoesterase [Bacteroidales bacterium]